MSEVGRADVLLVHGFDFPAAHRGSRASVRSAVFPGSAWRPPV